LAYVEDVVTHHYPSSTGRDNPARRRTVTRNALWATWLCRPLPAVLARTLAVGLRGRHDPIARAALVEAARGLPWVLARRRVVPPRVERAIRLLEASGRWSP
jgi:hypothetical protein